MTKTSIFRRSGLLLLLITILVGPFFQGYFFPTPTVVATAMTALGFAVWLYGRRKDRLATDLVGHTVDRLLLGLVGWAVLTTAWSVYARGNLDVVLQYGAAFLAYLVARQERSPSSKHLLVWLVSTSAAVVALMGLLEYGGFFMQYPALGNLLKIEPQQSRLFSLFQYPNTAATFFLIVMLIQNAMLIQSESPKQRVPTAAVSGLLSIAFILTLSRGALLIAPVAFLILWIGLSKKHVVSSLLHLVSAVAAPSAVALYPILQAARTDNWVAVLSWALLAAAVAALATGLIGRLLQLSQRTQVISVGILVLLVVTVGVTVGQGLVTELPKAFSRITQLEASALTTDGRTEFLQDALKLTKKRPWGYGGGGWVRTYQQVQQVNYTARDPHSHYALTLVESGVPGLLLLVAAIALAAFNAFRARKGDPVRWAMAAAALALAAHAAIDIDLSYFMMWLLLWVLLGAAQPDAEPIPLKQERRFAFPIAMAIALITLALSGTLATAAFSYQAAQTALLQKDNNAAYKAATRAIKLDPLNSQYLAMVPTAQNVARALKLDPNNEELWRFISQLKEQEDDISSALAAAQQALRLRPMHVGHYENIARLVVEQMTEALDRGELEQASTHAQGLIALGQAMEQRGMPSLERQKQAFQAYPALTWTPNLNLAVGKADLIAGDTKAAEAKLKAALTDKNLGPDAALWLHALYTRANNQEALKALTPQPAERMLKSSLYDALLELP